MSYYVRYCLITFLVCLRLFAPDNTQVLTKKLQWISSEGVTLGRSIGRGDYGEIIPLSGGAVKPNRILKMYGWDLEDRSLAGKSNVSDTLLLKFLNANERVRHLLGDNAIDVDGVMNWNDGSKGIVFERLPEDADIYDIKDGQLVSRNANERTLKEAHEALLKLSRAGLLNEDVHFAVLKNGSIKFFDCDLVEPVNTTMGSSPHERFEKIHKKVLGHVHLAIAEQRGQCFKPLTKIGLE